jgi:hypothetical protein
VYPRVDVSALWAYLVAVGPETVIWLVGLRALVSCWDVTTGTPSSSVSPDPSDIHKASDPVQATQIHIFRFFIWESSCSHKVASSDHYSTVPCNENMEPKDAH